MSDLAEFFAELVRDSGMTQVELARSTGFSQKHISGMLCHGEGLLTSWDRLLQAAGVTIRATENPELPAVRPEATAVQGMLAEHHADMRVEQGHQQLGSAS